MRLGTCVALELAIAAGAAGGVWFAASRGPDLVRGYLHDHEAIAATVSPPGPGGSLPTPLERANLTVALPEPDTVFGTPDHELLAPIAATPVTKVKFNHGGSSLSLRVDFASGARAAFKPMQIHPQSDPRREIAAYRVDRLLGIGHVAPAKSAEFSVEELLAAFEPASRSFAAGRLAEEAVLRRGLVVGEMSWWIPEIKSVRIGGKLIDEPDGMALWTGYLQAGAARPAELRPMLSQISTVILFDLLIDNADRWSGNNTQGSPDNRILYFMDNTLSFSAFTLGHANNLSKLTRIQVFPRALVGKLRALTLEQVSAVLGREDDLLGPLLTDIEISAIMARRDHILEYIDKLIVDLGEDAVLALP